MSQQEIELDPETVKFDCEVEDLLFGYAVIMGVPVEGSPLAVERWPIERQKVLKEALKKCPDPSVSRQIVQEIRGEIVDRRVDLRPYFKH